MSEPAKVLRNPIRIISREKAAFKDTYGGAVGIVALGGFVIRPEAP